MFPRGRPEGTTSAPEALRTAPGAPKTAPREGPDGGPHQRFPAFSPKQPPEGPKRSPTDPEEATQNLMKPQEAPRKPPRGPKRLPRDYVPGKASGNMIPAALLGARPGQRGKREAGWRDWRRGGMAERGRYRKEIAPRWPPRRSMPLQG